jgi:prepilin peptidase CpaA
MLVRLLPLYQLLLALIVVIAGYYDIRWRRIPNWLTLPAWIVGFALNAFVDPVGHFLTDQPVADHWRGLLYALGGFLAAMIVYFPLYLLRGMGAGDVKLMAAIGALVGWRDWIAIFILSGILGGVVALVLMIGKGRVRRTLFNTGFVAWEMAHFRAPHLKRSEFDISDPRAFTLPHGAVIFLGVVLFLGLHALIP